jgi:hypothetical protein
VISESFYIKRDLAHALVGIENQLLNWTVETSDRDGHHDGSWESEPSLEDALLAIEQFVFWAGFAIRKLIESQKLSDEFEAQQLAVLLIRALRPQAVRTFCPRII